MAAAITGTGVPGARLEQIDVATDEVRVDVRAPSRGAMFRYGQHVSAVERFFTRHNPLVSKSGRLSRVRPHTYCRSYGGSPSARASPSGRLVQCHGEGTSVRQLNQIA